MATMEEFDTIEVIKAQKLSSKGTDIATSLSGGRKYYKKAIGSIRRSGAWTMWVTIAATVVAIVKAVFDIVQILQHDSLDWIYVTGWFIGIIACCFLTLFFGYRVFKLESTPTFTLVSLIITLVCNLALSVGILPLVSLFLNIVALVRWSTYKDWFYRIDTKRSE